MKKENQPISESDKIIVKAQNKLVSAHFHYTQCQMDILFYLLSIAKDNEKEYSFPMKNIKKLTGREWKSDHVKIHTETMMKNIITFEDTFAPKEKWKHMSLFQEILYDNGIITVTLTEKALPLFKQTKEQFTYFELKYGLLLSSKYSKRLYWYLCQWKTVGKVHVFNDELRSLLDIELTKDGKERYATGGQFKRMIEETCEEINKITDIHVSCSWNKTIRTISSVTFLINNIQPTGMESDINYHESQEKGEALQYFKMYGLTEEQSLQMYDRGCRIKDMKRVVKQINETIKNKARKGLKVDNLEAYLITALQNEGYLSKIGYTAPDNKENKERKDAIKMIQRGISEGYPIELFAKTMEKYNIRDDEIQN